MTYIKIDNRVPLYRRTKLGRNINHDPRSWDYRVAHISTVQTVQWGRAVPVFDQGNLGSCTGNAGIGSLGSGSNYVPAKTIPQTTYTFDENGAIALYSAATKLDSDPDNYPPTDTGSDGLSIAKVLKSVGLISGYQHAFGLTDAFTAITQGPLIVGTYWMNDMFNPDRNGVVKPTGKIAGGHEYSCIGYDTASDLWHFVNSWGTGWGKSGHFYYSSDTFDALLKQQGDIILFTPANVVAPQPTPTPTPSPQPAPFGFDDAAKVLDPWAAKNHRIHAAQAWSAYAQAVRAE